MAVLVGTAQAGSLLSPSKIDRNIRVGFAAQSGFELVPVDRVPISSHQQDPSATGIAYHERVTYRLDSNPDAYKARDKGLKHIKWVTLAWREGRDASPFVFDLYVHGDADAQERLAIRVVNLDIRKFLHQSVAAFSTDRHLIRLQAYFEEFARKAKIIYPLAVTSPDRMGSQLGEHPLAQRIFDLKLTNNCREPGNYEIEIRDALGRYLLRANVSFSTRDDNTFLVRSHGLSIREQGTGDVELRLLNEATDAHAVNFIFGNFSINVGQSAELLLGLGPQPLIAAYNQNPYQEILRYGLAYGADGVILDHHDRRIGVEKVCIDRLDAYTYRVRLIAYERILPVWEGIVRLPAVGSATSLGESMEKHVNAKSKGGSVRVGITDF